MEKKEGRNLLLIEDPSNEAYEEIKKEYGWESES
jgi:hypothetical protein